MAGFDAVVLIVSATAFCLFAARWVMRAPDLRFRPALAAEWLGWLLGWVTLNVLANFSGMQIVLDVILHRWLGTSIEALPAVMRSDVFWLAWALLPSIAQFNFQEDSRRVFSSPMDLAGNLLLFLLDLGASTAGLYFFALSLAGIGVTTGVLPAVNVSVLVTCLAIAFIGGVVCQYKAHRLAYYVVGRTPPRILWPWQEGDSYDYDDETEAWANA